MFEAETSRLPEQEEPEIARHEVSDDGVTWRPYDPVRDRGATLHRRIVFAPPQEE